MNLYRIELISTTVLINAQTTLDALIKWHGALPDNKYADVLGVRKVEV